MRWHEITETENTLKLPDIDVGDTVLVGKFKNRRAEVTGFTKDDRNQPVLKTTKGDQKLFKPRLEKLMAVSSTVTEHDSLTIPNMPVSGLPIGTVLYLISGGDFNEVANPFVDTLDGWRQLDKFTPIKGRQDGLLKSGGETLPDADLKSDPRRKGLAAKPSWPTISHLYQIEALPPGTVILAPPVDEYDTEDRRRMTKQSDNFWTAISYDTKAPVRVDPQYMDGYLGRYTLVRIGAALDEASDMRQIMTLAESLFADAPAFKAEQEFYDNVDHEWGVVVLTDLLHKSSDPHKFDWPIEGDDWLVLDQIEASKKGKGYGSKMLNLLCAVCDKHGVKIFLDANTFGSRGLGQNNLVQFYANAGFEPCPEMKKFAHHAMVRYPARDDIKEFFRDTH